jgi:hypothetical protein
VARTQTSREPALAAWRNLLLDITLCISIDGPPPTGTKSLRAASARRTAAGLVIRARLPCKSPARRTATILTAGKREPLACRRPLPARSTGGRRRQHSGRGVFQSKYSRRPGKIQEGVARRVDESKSRRVEFIPPEGSAASPIAGARRLNQIAACSLDSLHDPRLRSLPEDETWLAGASPRIAPHRAGNWRATWRSPEFDRSQPRCRITVRPTQSWAMPFFPR